MIFMNMNMIYIWWPTANEQTRGNEFMKCCKFKIQMGIINSKFRDDACLKEYGKSQRRTWEEKKWTWEKHQLEAHQEQREIRLSEFPILKIQQIPLKSEKNGWREIWTTRETKSTFWEPISFFHQKDQFWWELFLQFYFALFFYLMEQTIVSFQKPFMSIQQSFKDVSLFQVSLFVLFIFRSPFDWPQYDIVWERNAEFPIIYSDNHGHSWLFRPFRKSPQEFHFRCCGSRGIVPQGQTHKRTRNDVFVPGWHLSIYPGSFLEERREGAIPNSITLSLSLSVSFPSQWAPHW